MKFTVQKGAPSKEMRVLDTIEFELLLVPHGKKMAVADLPAGSDPADPPLTPKAKEQAKETTEMMLRGGPPSLVVVSTRRRAWDTAKSAVERFVYGEGVPLLSLKSFGQLDSGDHDPGHPDADHRGLVLYGERSTLADWWRWTHESVTAIATLQKVCAASGRPVWGFSHRPIVAMFRWIARNGLVPPTESDDFGELDPSLFPFIRVKVRFSRTDGLLSVTELPGD